MNSRLGVTATTDMAVLPGVLAYRSLRRTVQVRLGTNTLRLPGGTSIFVVSRQEFLKPPGYQRLKGQSCQPLSWIHSPLAMDPFFS